MQTIIGGSEKRLLACIQGCIISVFFVKMSSDQTLATYTKSPII